MLRWSLIFVLDIFDTYAKRTYQKWPKRMQNSIWERSYGHLKIIIIFNNNRHQKESPGYLKEINRYITVYYKPQRVWMFSCRTRFFKTKWHFHVWCSHFMSSQPILLIFCLLKPPITDGFKKSKTNKIGCELMKWEHHMW